MPIDTHIGHLVGLEDSQNWLQETETSRDLRQTSIDWDLTFLDSDGSNDGGLDNAGGAVDSQISNRLSLSLEDSPSGEAGPAASGVLEETSCRQDGANTTEGAYAEVVRVATFNFFSSDGTRRSRCNKGHME